MTSRRPHPPARAGLGGGADATAEHPLGTRRAWQDYPGKRVLPGVTQLLTVLALGLGTWGN